MVCLHAIGREGLAFPMTGGGGINGREEQRGSMFKAHATPSLVFLFPAYGDVRLACPRGGRRSFLATAGRNQPIGLS